MNEALPYVEATHRIYGGTYGQGPGPGENLPSWMTLAHNARTAICSPDYKADNASHVSGWSPAWWSRLTPSPSWPRRSGWIRPRNSLYRWTALEVSAASDPLKAISQRGQQGQAEDVVHATEPRVAENTAQIRVKGTSMDPTVVVVHIARFPGRSQSMAGVVT